MLEKYRGRLLDAIPLMIFVVDEDVKVIDANAGALEALQAGLESVLRKRGGEVLHCINAQSHPDGCGRAPACEGCTIRVAVADCLAGQRVVRRRMKAELRPAGLPINLELLVSASRIEEEAGVAVLVLEDISELVMLQQIIPICMYCKKVKSDTEGWQTLEAYVSDKPRTALSHGICPDCLRVRYPHLKR